jgi:hypothetical protein
MLINKYTEHKNWKKITVTLFHSCNPATLWKTMKIFDTAQIQIHGSIATLATALIQLHNSIATLAQLAALM